MIQSLQTSNNWFVDVLNENTGGRVSILDFNKPGFDYDQNEMIKLKIWPQGIIPYFIDEISFGKLLLLGTHPK